MSSGGPNRSAMLARLERYAELRQQGMLPVDASREIGLQRAEAYERWYRRERLKLPDRSRGGVCLPWHER
jgi:hypothetical protein